MSRVPLGTHFEYISMGTLSRHVPQDYQLYSEELTLQRVTFVTCHGARASEMSNVMAKERAACTPRAIDSLRWHKSKSISQQLSY